MYICKYAYLRTDKVLCTPYRHVARSENLEGRVIHGAKNLGGEQ